MVKEKVARRRTGKARKGTTDIQDRERMTEEAHSAIRQTGTAAALEDDGISVDIVVGKVGEAIGVDAVELISSGKCDLVINTPRGRGSAGHLRLHRNILQSYSAPFRHRLHQSDRDGDFDFGALRDTRSELGCA